VGVLHEKRARVQALQGVAELLAVGVRGALRVRLTGDDVGREGEKNASSARPKATSCPTTLD
jgi:hypothetical protein